MKKFLFVISIILCSTCLIYAQNVVINNQTGYGDCGFRINGICSSQDIGGVEIDARYCYRSSSWIKVAQEQIGDVYIANYYLFATNYNPFRVTVLIAIQQQGRQQVYSAVIPANGVKVFSMGHCTDVEPYSIIGSITRKMAQ